MLGQSVFKSDIERAFLQALTDAKSTNTKLRVLLSVEAKELRSLHWERLCYPFDGNWSFILKNQLTPYSLYLPSIIDRRYPPIDRRQLRALVLIANSQDLDGNYKNLPYFNVETAADCICTALGNIKHDILASIEDAIGTPDLGTLIEQIAYGNYTILHIICHGAFNADTKETIFFFPGDIEKKQPVTTSKLIEALRRLTPLPHFTFLSSCESAMPKGELGFGGAAQRLVRELGMPAVLAMTDKIPIETYEIIAQSFYSRLYKHGEVDLAVNESLSTLHGKHDITTTVLFSRLGNRRLFYEQTNIPPTPTEIQTGLDKLRDEVEKRAPILVGEFRSIYTQFSETPEPKNEKIIADVINKANNLCTEIFDGLSFIQIAFGEEPDDYFAGECPFPGISSFEEKDKKFFFGRDHQIDDILKKHAEYPFLAIFGASGSGKSSMVKAGLVPRLETHPLILTPGDNPVETLEGGLATVTNPTLIIVDQFEELFTLTESRESRLEFIEQLLEGMKTHKILLVMRSDFLGECADYEILKLEIENHLMLLSPIKANKLSKIIDQQIDTAKLRFDVGLRSKIEEDVISEPGAMALFQHALKCLWERRRGSWLRYHDYEDIGGIKKAISNTADDFYNALSLDEQELVRGIFLRMIRFDNNADSEPRDTRRRVNLQELITKEYPRSMIVDIVSDLASKGLIITSIEIAVDKENKIDAEKIDAETITVEIAHEFLIQHWPKLREWLAENRDELLLRETIRTAALDWIGENRVETMLVHRGGRLDDAIAISQRPKTVLNTLEFEYVNACLAFHEKERKEVERRRQRIIVGLSIALLITLMLALYAFIQRAEMKKQRQIALDSLLLAQTQLLDLRESKNAVPKFGLAIEAFIRLKSIEAYEVLWSSLYQFRPDTRFLIADGNVQDICFFPDRSTLVSITSEAIQAWDKDNGDEIIRIGLEDPFMKDPENIKILCSADGKYMFSLYNNIVAKWGIDNGTQVFELAHEDTVIDMMLNPDGQSLITGSKDGQLKLWNAITGKLTSISLHDSSIEQVLFSPDGGQIAFATEGGEIFIWDMVTNDFFELITGTSDFFLTYSPDGQWLVSGGKNGQVIIWNAKDGEKHKTLYHIEDITAITYSSDGNLLFSASRNNEAKVWDGADFSEISSIITFGHIMSADFSPNSQYIVIGGYSGYAEVLELGRIDLMGQALLKKVVSIPCDGQITKTNFSPDGSSFVCVGEKNLIYITPTKTNILHHDQQVWNIEFNRSNDMLVTSSRDGTAKVWDVSTGMNILEVSHDDWVNYATFNRVGDLIATASSDHTAKVWSVPNGENILTIPHQMDVTNVNLIRVVTLSLLLDGMGLVAFGISQTEAKFLS